MTKYELTQEIIDNLKTTYPDSPLYKKTLFGQDFVFTHIDRATYRLINEWIESNPKVKVSDVDSKMVDYALLWPKFTPVDWMTMPAGAIPTLAKLIQDKSYLATDDSPNDWYSAETLVESTVTQKISDKERETLKNSIKAPARIVTIQNRDFVIRAMMRPEYSALMKLPKEVDGEVEGVKGCVIWPKNVQWEKLEAGIPTVIATEVMRLSGFGDTGNVTEL